MEKLQAAIEKAKSRRAGQSAPQAQPQAPTLAPETTDEVAAAVENAVAEMQANPEDVQGAWTSLQAFKPRPKVLRKNRILSLDTNDDTLHYYDMLRTRILQRVRREGWKRIMITSPDSGCGKSTIASNLAMSFSRNAELRTILIDLDLRRPSIARFFGRHSDDSFHDVLRGQGSFADHAVRIGANLAVATNRTPARRSSELLQSEGAIKVLDEIEQTYQPDIILFDMPPMLGNDDTYAFMQQVDCAVLITAAESTALEQIDKCEKDLAEQVPVVGVVLNKCRYTEKEKGYVY